MEMVRNMKHTLILAMLFPLLAPSLWAKGEMVLIEVKGANLPAPIRMPVIVHSMAPTPKASSSIGTQASYLNKPHHKPRSRPPDSNITKSRFTRAVAPETIPDVSQRSRALFTLCPMTMTRPHQRASFTCRAKATRRPTSTWVRSHVG